VGEDKRKWLNGPAIDPEDQKQFSTIGTKRDTAQVHPEKFSKYILEMAKQRGNVTVREGTLAKGLIMSSNGENRVCGVEIEDGDNIEDVDDVILCAGPWMKTISNWLTEIHPVLAERLNNAIIPEKYYSLVIRPKSEEDRDNISATALFLKNSCPASKLSEPEIYPRPNGFVYVCGCEECTDLPEDPSQVNPTKEEHCRTLSYCAANVANSLRVKEYFEESITADLVAKQACYLPISRTNVPIIGPVPGALGLWIAAGHGCWGILNSPATGFLVAELLLSGSSSLVDIHPFTPQSVFSL